MNKARGVRDRNSLGAGGTPLESATFDRLFDLFSLGQWGALLPDADLSPGDVEGWGLRAGNNQISAGNHTSGADTDGKFVTLTGSGGSPQSDFIRGSAQVGTPTTNPIAVLDAGPIAWRCKVAPTLFDTDTNHFIGWSSEQNVETVAAAAAPASDHFGFQLYKQAPRDDAAWQLSRDATPGGGSQVLLPTGIPAVVPGTGVGFFEITSPSPTTLQARILDNTGAELWSSGVLATGILGAARPLRMGWAVNRANSGVVSFGRWYGETIGLQTAAAP